VKKTYARYSPCGRGHLERRSKPIRNSSVFIPEYRIERQPVEIGRRSRNAPASRAKMKFARCCPDCRSKRSRGFFSEKDCRAKYLKNLAPRAGFEPATNRLTAGCSTTELPGNSSNMCARVAYNKAGQALKALVSVNSSRPGAQGNNTAGNFIHCANGRVGGHARN
jgi:hypothetical protein